VPPRLGTSRRILIESRHNALSMPPTQASRRSIVGPTCQFLYKRRGQDCEIQQKAAKPEPLFSRRNKSFRQYVLSHRHHTTLFLSDF
jgi:hypothetical protein